MEVTGRFFIKTRENQLVCLISVYKRKLQYYCANFLSLIPSQFLHSQGFKVNHCCSKFQNEILVLLITFLRTKSYFLFWKTIRNIRKTIVRNLLITGSEIPFSLKCNWLQLLSLWRDLWLVIPIVLTYSKAMDVVNYL